MNKYVITIARENGSEGRAIGLALADELGVECYSRKLLHLASLESGISEELFGKNDEQITGSLLNKAKISLDAYKGEVFPPDSEEFTSPENLVRYQAYVIRKLAAAGGCVIIGRCADYVLRDQPNVVRVFVHASQAERLKVMTFRHHVNEGEARRMMEQTDKRRAEYYRSITGRNWRDAGNYDLSIDTGKVGVEGAKKRILAYIAALEAEKAE